MTTQPPQGDFPPVHPSGTDLTQFTRPEWLLRLPNFLVQLIEKIVGLVVQAITGVFLPGPIGSAFNQLVNWATTLLPAQILEPFQELVDALIDLLGRIPFVGPVISQLAEMFGFMNDDTVNAQGSADTANIGVASLNAQLAAIGSGGDGFTDNFDRTASTLGTNWSETYSSGSGSMATNGNNAYWDASGGGSRIGYGRYTTALMTDTQLVSIVQTSPKNASNTEPDLRLILRADSTMNNFVMAIIEHNVVQIGYVVSGNYTRLGSTVAQTTANGDRWELRAGTATDERQFLLYRNDGLVCDRTDAGDVSLLGASNRYVGFGMQAGVHFIPFIGFQQMAPPSVQGWAAADRAA